MIDIVFILEFPKEVLIFANALSSSLVVLDGCVRGQTNKATSNRRFVSLVDLNDFEYVASERILAIKLWKGHVHIGNRLNTGHINCHDTSVINVK